MKTNKALHFTESLESLSAQELENRLNEELSRSNSDEERVYALLREIKRRKTTPCELTPEASAAWHKFLQRKKNHATPPRSKPSFAIMRAAAIVAVVILLFSAIPTALGAENVFTLVAHWTDSIFAFFDPEDPIETQPPYRFETDHQDLQRIYDVVTALGVTTPVIPSWVPEGYELTELGVADSSGLCKVCAVMQNGSHYITIDIRIYRTQDTQTIHEKDANALVILEIQNTSHYVMSNLGVQAATWTSESIQCNITTDENQDTLTNILQSIYDIRG